jgi:ubiquinone/menaquinone biosynthesis C-methylase UbiE
MPATLSLPRTELLPNWSFRLMKLAWRFTDTFGHPDRNLNEFGIKPGYTVIDYGCGPGRYIQRAAELVGPEGQVYAVDIHDLAIRSVLKLKNRYRLKNVHPMKAEEYFAPIPEDTADLIYVLDAFHMVSNPTLFLEELHRHIKHHGRLILEDGHQSRRKTLRKIARVDRWRVIGEHKRYVVLVPAWKFFPE